MKCSKCYGLIIGNEESCITCGQPVSSSTTPAKPIDKHIRFVTAPGGMRVLKISSIE